MNKRLLGRLKSVKLFVFDMDGTIYIDKEVFPWTIPLMQKFIEKGIKYVFLSNNSSKAPWEYEDFLRRIGIPNPKVFTSGEATAAFVKSKFGKKRVYIFGTESLKKVFENQGLKVVDEGPEVLVLGYDTTASYEKIKKFALYLRNDLPYIATHPDVNCPSKEGLIPDAGSFIALFEKSTSRKPDYIIGKPNPEMLYIISKTFGIKIDEVAMVGDRLYTDIKMALAAGALPVLVLSGETKEEDLKNVDEKEVLILKNIGELSKLMVL